MLKSSETLCLFGGKNKNRMFKVDIKKQMIDPGRYKEKNFQLNFWLNDLKLFVFAMVKVETECLKS